MAEWSIQLHRETGTDDIAESVLLEYVTALAELAPEADATPQGRVTLRLVAAASSASEAVGLAHGREQVSADNAGLGGSVTSILVAAADSPDGDATWVRTPLLSVSEVGERLGVSRQRASQLAQDHPQFPKQSASYAGRPLFEQAAIEAFADTWDRKTGRPPANPQ